jgi:hypothetical protein
MSAEQPTTYSWAQATKGALTTTQCHAIDSAILRSYLQIAASLATYRRNRTPGATPLPAPPDSRLCALASEAARDQSAAVTAHGYRTWLLATELADHDRARTARCTPSSAPGSSVVVDGELLFVASLLHDFGLMSEVIGEDFTIRSARTVLEVCEHAGRAYDGMTLADSVVAHATPGLKANDDRVGFYVQAGAMADLGGLRMWDLPAGYLRAAYDAYPAHDVHREMPKLVRREARAVRAGRFAILRRWGMNVMMTVFSNAVLRNHYTRSHEPSVAGVNRSR